MSVDSFKQAGETGGESQPHVGPEEGQMIINNVMSRTSSHTHTHTHTHTHSLLSCLHLSHASLTHPYTHCTQRPCAYHITKSVCDQMGGNPSPPVGLCPLMGHCVCVCVCLCVCVCVCVCVSECVCEDGGYSFSPCVPVCSVGPFCVCVCVCLWVCVCVCVC